MKWVGIAVIIAVAAGVYFSSEEEALSARKPKFSTLKVTAKKAGDRIGLDFQVGTIDNIVVNDEGPWSLRIKDLGGLRFTKKNFRKKDFDLKKPGIYIESTKKPSGLSGTVSYRLTTFICTKNKEKCYREVHEGSTKWAYK